MELQIYKWVLLWWHWEQKQKLVATMDRPSVQNLDAVNPPTKMSRSCATAFKIRTSNLALEFLIAVAFKTPNLKLKHELLIAAVPYYLERWWWLLNLQPALSPDQLDSHCKDGHSGCTKTIHHCMGTIPCILQVTNALFDLLANLEIATAMN